MRWFWVDRFLEIEKGKTAKAVKNISLSEDHLHDHFPGFPVMPPTLMIESLAQTGGILVGHAIDFKKNVILVKIPKMQFFSLVRPGDQLILESEILDLREEVSTVRAWGSVAGEKVIEGEIIFFHIESKPGSEIESDFVFTEELLSTLNINQQPLSGVASQ